LSLVPIYFLFTCSDTCLDIDDFKTIATIIATAMATTPAIGRILHMKKINIIKYTNYSIPQNQSITLHVKSLNQLGNKLSFIFTCSNTCMETDDFKTAYLNIQFTNREPKSWTIVFGAWNHHMPRRLFSIFRDVPHLDPDFEIFF
jgi:hypothetical protein